jgi:hypothetical protein
MGYIVTACPDNQINQALLEPGRSNKGFIVPFYDETEEGEPTGFCYGAPPDAETMAAAIVKDQVGAPSSGSFCWSKCVDGRGDIGEDKLVTWEDQMWFISSNCSVDGLGISCRSGRITAKAVPPQFLCPDCLCNILGETWVTRGGKSLYM